MAEERFATKDEILKAIKESYKKKKISYKEFMVQINKVEKHYDEWKKGYEAERGINNEIDMTNEELAIGKRLTELQVKKDNILDKEKVLIDEEKADD